MGLLPPRHTTHLLFQGLSMSSPLFPQSCLHRGLLALRTAFLHSPPSLLPPFLWLRGQHVARYHVQVCSEGEREAIAMQGGINVHPQLAL